VGGRRILDETMIGKRRSLLLLALTAPLFAATAPAAVAIQGSSEIQALFQEGQRLFRQGQKAEALERFTRVLALQPSNEDAYELWKIADQQVLLDLLVQGGQSELVAARLMELAGAGRMERQGDPQAIRELLRRVEAEDPIERRRALRELAANHGEYAVPLMVRRLADQNNDDRRVLYMHLLTQMDTDVVLPLVAAMGSDDPFLRRNVASVLGYIGDRRAAAALAWHARHDADPSARDAARDAAGRVGSDGNPLALFLDLGDDYHHARATVLRPSDYSRVVWSWDGEGLVATGVPRFLYADELSKHAYHQALRVDPSSLAARAGLARAYACQQAELLSRSQAGLDESDLEEQMAPATIALNNAGVEAIDLALSWSLRAGNTACGVRLAQVLGQLSLTPTPALADALGAGDGAISAQAAVALGEIAYRSGVAPSQATIHGLTRAATLQVMRVAAVIDSNAARGRGISDALSAQGVVVHHWERGSNALGMLRRIPGIDAIVVAEELQDLTVDQVLRAIARDDRMSQTPILMLTADEDRAQELYGEQIAGTFSSLAGVTAVVEAMDARLGRDRELALAIAARAAGTLERLAHGPARSQLAGAADALAGVLDGRPDSVVVPVLGALGAMGGAEHMAAVSAVIVDDSRSSEARVAAAEAAGSIAGRTGASPGAEALATLAAVLGSEASLEVRSALSRAMGRMPLSPQQRAALLGATRVNVGVAQ
jgi:CheY-like chemotaxis protein